MALTLQLRARVKWKTLALTNPSLTHRFSTSNSDDGDAANPKSPFSSYFSDVKDKLKKTQPTASSLRNSPTSSFAASDSTPRPSKVDSLDEIRKNLSEFRRRTSAPAPAPAPAPAGGEPSSSEQISLHEIYKRNVPEKSGESARSAGGKLSWDAIRASMQQLRSNASKQGGDPMPLPAFRDNLKSSPSGSAATSSSVIGGAGELPASIFAKEMREKKGSSAAAVAATTEFVKMYSYGELGGKLRTLRPQGGGREGFSLGELNERLMRLRELEEKESRSTLKGVAFHDLREGLMRLKQSDEEKAKKTSRQKIDILGHLGRTPSSMLDPPKEHLVERYFHPDNMSSAEKLKIELAKVRDEFKMSESDCGSARVQVAQLTTKIKHLSSVLHKKDKHSRKGLLAMVQRRKRLLKYLRSTDWDSYCFVISKLGLRDNPDIKS